MNIGLYLTAELWASHNVATRLEMATNLRNVGGTGTRKSVPRVSGAIAS